MKLLAAILALVSLAPSRDFVSELRANEGKSYSDFTCSALITRSAHRGECKAAEMWNGCGGALAVVDEVAAWSESPRSQAGRCPRSGRDSCRGVSRRRRVHRFNPGARRLALHIFQVKRSVVFEARPRASLEAMMKRKTNDRRSPQDTTILAPDSVRRDLKVIAALTGSTMKEVLARLVAAELRKVNT